MRWNLRIALLSCAGLAVLASPVAACGLCAVEAAKYTYPPLNAWIAIGVALFALHTIADQMYRPEPRVMPRPIFAWVIVAASALSLPVMGPTIAFFCILILVVATLGFFIRGRKLATPKRRQAFYFTTTVALIAAAGFSLAEIISPTPRDPVSVIAWGYSGPVARQQFKALGDAGAASAPQYRELLVKGNDYYAGESAKRLATIGDAHTDVPLIIDALERFQTQAPYSGYAFQDALNQITGLNLPRETTVEQWRSAWAGAHSST